MKQLRPTWSQIIDLEWEAEQVLMDAWDELDPEMWLDLLEDD